MRHNPTSAKYIQNNPPGFNEPGFNEWSYHWIAVEFRRYFMIFSSLQILKLLNIFFLHRTIQFNVYSNLNKKHSLFTKLLFFYWLILWIIILLIWKEKVKKHLRDLLFNKIMTGLEENVFNSLIYCFRDCEWVKKSRILDFIIHVHDKSQQIIWYFVRTPFCLPLRFRPAGCNQKRKEELRFPKQFDKIWCDCAETRLFAPCPGKLAFFWGWLGV